METRTSKATPQKLSTKSKTAVRGKYFNQLPKGTNLAIIDPDLHEHFPDSESVNQALRVFLYLREHMRTVAPSRSNSKRQPKAA